MIAEPLPSNPDTQSSKALRRRFEDAVRTLGLRASGARESSPTYRKIRYALELTSPLSAAFGRHLSTRFDLLPAALCDELAGIPDSGAATSATLVREIFAAQLGCPPELAFAQFDSEPDESRLFWQSHRARLGQADVTVRIIHPEWARLRENVNSLSAFRSCLEAHCANPRDFDCALADFSAHLAGETTFDAETRCAGLAATSAQADGMLAVPVIYEHLCSSLVTTRESWRPLIGDFPRGPDAARTVCLLWLRQVLEGVVYPADPRLENLGHTADFRIVFGDGGFAAMPNPAREHLRSYLNAMVADNADEAAASLTAATGRQVPDSVFVELRRQFRQMAPFRDGFPNSALGEPDPDGRRLGEELLIHWRIAAQMRLTEGTPLTSFFRALLTMLRTAGQLAPGYDPLPDAVRDFRLLSAFGDIRAAMQPAEIGRLMEGYVTAMVGMPEQADRFLAVTARHGFQPPVRDSPDFPGAEDRYLAPFGLLLAAAGVAMVLHRFAWVGGPALERGSALVVLGFGVIVLRAIARSR